MIVVCFWPFWGAFLHFLCVKLRKFVYFSKAICKFFTFFFSERPDSTKKPAMRSRKAGHIV